MGYVILTKHTLEALQRDVNTAIADGWRPIGGVAVDHKTDWYLQAMVKGGERKGK